MLKQYGNVLALATLPSIYGSKETKRKREEQEGIRGIHGESGEESTGSAPMFMEMKSGEEAVDSWGKACYRRLFWRRWRCRSEK